MVVGSLELHLRIDGSRSLKEKRRALRPVIDRLRRDLHLSCAEVGDQDLWNVATLGVACVATDRATAAIALQRAMSVVEGRTDIAVEGAIESYD